MKRLIILLSGLALGLAVASAQPGVKFTTKSHDFGTIAEDGGPVSYEFEFENIGDQPLVIVSARASCGCTRPKYPTDPIKPGKKGKIKVTYLPEGRPGAFDKTVKVRTNAKKNGKVALTISGSVAPSGGK